jgi:Tfp pilus tip-associated adhesin PilY1
MVQLNDSNASAIGALIAPATAVPGVGATQWTSIVRAVLAGALGGVDRSTVAVIAPSSFAGSANRPTMVYFGATDGMLHAVCAAAGGTTDSGTSICPRAGTELWAFIPRVQLPLIRTNTARVDGSPRVVDVFGDFSGSSAGVRSWRTVLTFQTGFAVDGKPAAYAIDVTDPASPTVLWEYTTPSVPGTLDLGTGLTVAAGATLIDGQHRNLAILQTSNGGTGGAGVVATALSQETGAKIWQFGYAYPVPPRGVATDTVLLPTTGIVGGAVAVDLAGGGLLTDVVFGDLYGNLWRLNATDGTSRNGTSTPLFRFSQNKQPIGAVPAIYSSGGQQYAVIASGGYADPTAMSWTASTQYLIAARLASRGATIDETATQCASCALALSTTLSAGHKAFSQALVVGSQLFVVSDSSDVNLTAFGTTSSTGKATVVNLSGTASPTIVAVNAGASSLVNSRTTIYNSSSTQQELLQVVAASTTGTSVDSASIPRLTRMLWLPTQ